MRLGREILIFLIDESHTLEQGIVGEFENERGMRIWVFSDFDQASAYFNKKPDVIIMDQPKDAFVRNRIRTRIDNIRPKIKIIFLSEPGQHKEVMLPEVYHDDYVVRDASLQSKVRLAVDEFVFSKKFKEDYERDTLTLDHLFGSKLGLIVLGTATTLVGGLILLAKLV